jgi:hypothetical protein
MKRFESEKVAKWLNILVYVYVGIYIVVQVVLMIGIMFKWDISLDGFVYEFNVLTTILAIALNVNMTVFYCKNAGSPYKNEKMRKKVHTYAVAVSVWTVAFTARFLITVFG